MPSILSDDDKDTVKRFVPKQTNKIHAVAVAKLYVAYPSRHKWTNTGIQGAVVLANDLVGHTYWLKMVDISPASRGVIWDQEIFDSWSYNHDRTFFHTFEMEECLAGLSFVDEKEAKQFKKKMDDREKNASKQTKATPFGGGGHQEKKHGFLGGLFGSRHSSAPTPPESPRNNLPPAPANHSPSMSAFSLNSRQLSEFSLLDDFDPLWREHFGQDLTDKGLTDEFIKENQEFIVEFLREQQAQAQAQAARPAPPPPPPTNGDEARGSRPPPPPPPPGGRAEAPSPPTGAKAPPPPAPRRSGKGESETPEPPAGPPRPKFNAPPALPDAGKFARTESQAKAAPAPPPRGPNPGPPPPPRGAPKAQVEENHNHKFSVPPPLPPPSQRSVPPPPARGGVPPPPPPRSNAAPIPAAVGPPPPLPPKVPMGGPPPLPPTSNRPVPVPPAPAAAQQPSTPAPPLPPPNNANAPPPLPPLLPSSNSGAPPPPPPPPPPPSMGGPPPPPPPPPSLGGPPPPPPPPPSMGGPPPPPPNRDSGYSSAPSSGAQTVGRGAMLSDIQKAGGIGSLKKVDRSQIRDRSAAQVGDSDPSSTPAPSSAPGGAPNMANALAAALQKRKEKVSRSDDEDDDDDW